MKSQLKYTNFLPSAKQFPKETLLFYDSILSKNKAVKIWLKQFPFKIELNSGEKLKTLKSFNQVLNKITKSKVPKTTKLTFVAIGGGSVGDFASFLASVYLRGRRLILIPSTWLSAVDSAHGGKNGLNFQNTKNQIGTFNPAEQIFICKALLLTQPADRLTESMGEIIKIAILRDPKLFSKLEKQPKANKIYQFLPRIIGHKYAIVKKDPFEKTGIRRLLNLGHTMGHVFESAFGWPHGVAVLLGILFSARWSFYRGFLIEKDFIKISMLIENLNLKQDLDSALNKLSRNKLLTLLSKDKKLTHKDRLDFIFIKKIGICLREQITLDQILKEVERQKLGD